MASGSNSLWDVPNTTENTITSLSPNILTEADVVKLREQYPTYYQGMVEANQAAGGQVLTEADLGMLRQALLAREGQDESGVVRGAFSVLPGRRMRIDLFKDADYSTFVHEAAHFMLEVYRDLANAPGASAYIRKEYAAILRYLGAKPGQPLTRRQHEKFARAFERYLMEGKAPSAAMRGVFRQFKAWLLDIYQYFIRLNVELSDDIRAVFDRMLATDGEIAFMREAREMEPLFGSAKAVGADAAAFEAYEEAARLEWQTAEDALRADAMRQRLYESTRGYRKAYERMRQRAADAYDAHPAVRALHVLTAHKGFALDAARLRQVYGEDFLSLLPVVEGRRIYDEAGDLPLEEAAVSLGFDSGDAMIRAIARLPEREAYIRKEARRLLAEEGEALPGGRMAADPVGALCNAHRLERLRMELGFLARLDEAGKALPEGELAAQCEAMERQAVALVSGKRVGEVKPSLYFQAMQAAAHKAREAIERPRPDYAEAVHQKQAELMNLLLYREASRVLQAIREGVAQAEAVAEKPFEEAIRTRDALCVAKAKWMAASLGLGGDAEALLAQIRAEPAGRQAGREVVLDDGAAGPVEEMTAAAALEALGAVKGYWDLARREQVMVLDGRRVALSHAAKAVAARLRAFGRKGGGKAAAVTVQDGLMAALGGLNWQEARMEAFCREADCLLPGEAAGPLGRYVFEPVKKAAGEARQAQEAALLRLEEVLSGFGFVRETIAAPELGMTFGKATGYGKAELVHALLYAGSVSGMARLFAGNGRGGRPDVRRWEAFLSRMMAEGRLAREDFDRVEAIWDEFAVWMPKWQQAYQALYGQAFEGVEVRPFTVGKVYRGGFVPAADAGRVDGTGELNLPPVFDLAALRGQLGQMVMFAFMAPVGRDVSRLLEEDAVKAAFEESAPGVLDGVVKPWLACCMQPYEAVAGKGLTLLDGFPEAARLRAGASVFLDAGAKALGRYGMGAAVFDRVRPQEVMAVFQRMALDRVRVVQAVAAASPYMQGRMRAIGEAFSARLGQAVAPLADAGLQALAAEAFCAPVIWGAAYLQPVSGGLSHAEAVKAADKAVRQVLGEEALQGDGPWRDGGPLAPVRALFEACFAEKAAGRPGGGMAQRQADAAVLLLQTVLLPVWGGEALCRGLSGRIDGKDAKVFGGWLEDAFGRGALDGEGLSPERWVMSEAGDGRQGSAALSGLVFYPPLVRLTEAVFRAMAWAGPDGAFDASRFAQDMAAFGKAACGLDAAGADTLAGVADALAVEDGEAEADIPVFSRGEQAGSNQGMSVAAVEAIAKDLVMTFRNAPEIIVTESPLDFSPDAMPDGMGCFDPGTNRCYLFSRNISNADDATATFTHEVTGHYGLRGFFGDRLGDVLVTIRNHNPRIERLSQAWWRDNQDYIDKVRKNEGKNWTEEEFNNWQRDIAIEEALVTLADRGEKITGIKHLVVKIQRLLRQLGWQWAENLANSLEALTDAEALYALYKAELFVRGDIASMKPTTTTREHLEKYCVGKNRQEEEGEADIPVFSRGEQAGGEQTFYQQSLPETYE
ncbi:MAG: hypothetical protein NC211_09265 [Alistipes senegalensis]|nr:hypothetical protein [Oxalobacter formigenes]MCM1281997.1 hypothetical protein [Alistipes senegalensis]